MPLPSSTELEPDEELETTLKKSLMPLRWTSVVALSSQSIRKKAIIAVTKSA
jgi:hypothetical protein